MTDVPRLAPWPGPINQEHYNGLKRHELLLQKCSDCGKFRWWPRATDPASEERVKQLAAHELLVLFSAGNPEQTSAASDWRPVKPTGIS